MRILKWELPFPSPGHLLHPGFEHGSPALQADSLPTELPGKPDFTHTHTHTRKHMCVHVYIYSTNKMFRSII